MEELVPVAVVGLLLASVTVDPTVALFVCFFAVIGYFEGDEQ